MIRFTEISQYAGPFPRKRHYHRCPKCIDRGGNGVNCYKSKCTLPRDLKCCSWCGPVEYFASESPADPSPVEPAARVPGQPMVREIAQWYTLIDEKKRQCIFSALSESQRKQAFQYGLAVSWNLLPQYARDLVAAEWWGDQKPEPEPEPKPKTRELERIPVDPARVGWGPKNDGSARGDIKRSYSAQSIAENKGKIKNPFRHAGSDWVSIGSCSGGPIGSEYEECYRVVARDAFDGEAWEYGEHIGAGYHGMLVYWQGRPMVLAGPPCVFVADPQLAAAHLFDGDTAAICEGCGESECECGDPEDEPADFGLDFDAEEIAGEFEIDPSEVIPPARSKPVQLSLFGEL